MSDETILKLAITPHFKISIDREDGTEPEVWRLCLDYRALAKIEAETGLDLKKWDTWQNDDELNSYKTFPKIIWGALQKFSPEVTLDQVIDSLNPAAQRILYSQILEQCFPGYTAAYKQALAEIDKKDTGATDPGNVPTVATTTE